MSRHLRRMYMLADNVDREEGCLAYSRYHDVINMFAQEYGVRFDRTLAAFVALSPNNDYFGNLRSLASVLDGYRRGNPPGAITISTYNHCRDRACRYVAGEVEFLDMAKGPKIRAFYRNILHPNDRHHVTVDGHMKAAYVGQNLTMKNAIVRTRSEYRRIEDSVKRLAKGEGLLPNQIQATVWFARKRVLGIKYNPQLSLLNAPNDKWGTIVTPEQARPYERKQHDTSSQRRRHGGGSGQQSDPHRQEDLFAG